MIILDQQLDIGMLYVTLDAFYEDVEGKPDQPIPNVEYVLHLALATSSSLLLYVNETCFRRIKEVQAVVILDQPP